MLTEDFWTVQKKSEKTQINAEQRQGEKNKIKGAFVWSRFRGIDQTTWGDRCEHKVTFRTVASVQAGQLAVDAGSLQVTGRRAAADAFLVLQSKGALLRWSHKIKHNTGVKRFLQKRHWWIPTQPRKPAKNQQHW